MLAAFCSCCCIPQSLCSTAPIFSVGTLGNVFWSNSGGYRLALPDFLLPSPDSFVIKPITDGSSFVYRPFQFSNTDYSPPPSDLDWSLNPGTGQKTNSVYGWGDGSYPDGEPVDPRDVSHSYCVETNQPNSVLLIRRVFSGSSSQFYAAILPPVFKLDYVLLIRRVFSGSSSQFYAIS